MARLFVMQLTFLLPPSFLMLPSFCNLFLYYSCSVSTSCQLFFTKVEAFNLFLFFFSFPISSSFNFYPFLFPVSLFLPRFWHPSIHSPPCTLCFCPFLPVTIAVAPSIRPLFPVVGLPPSPSHSLAPLLQRTAGRRCTVPLPPSPTGRGNGSPHQLCTACVCVGPSVWCAGVCPSSSGFNFIVCLYFVYIVRMCTEFNWAVVLFSVEHSKLGAALRCYRYF